MALFEGTKQILYLRNFLCEIGFSPGLTPTTIFQDNQSTISWVNEGLRKIKHIDLRFHFVQDVVSKEQVLPVFVKSEGNKADGLTKALPPIKFKEVPRSLGMSASGAV